MILSSIILNEIYTFKMIFGEEIVCKVIDQVDNKLLITNPLSVAPNPNGMGLIYTLLTANNEKTVEINTSSIVMFASTAENIKMKYIEATTGIATMSKKIVLG